MQVPTDVPWAMDWQWQHDRVELRSGSTRAGSNVTTRSLPLSVGLGWVFVHPLAAAIGSTAAWWTAAWLALWLLACILVALLAGALVFCFAPVSSSVSHLILVAMFIIHLSK